MKGEKTMKIDVNKIKIIMAEKEMTQSQLANSIGIGANRVSIIFKNEKASLTLIGKIAKALNVKVEHIVIPE